MTRLGIAEWVRNVSQPVILPIVKLLANWGVHPHLVTIICFLGFLVSSFFIMQGDFIIAGLILIFFAPLDAIDGALARYTNKVTAFGAFLDSVLDRYGEILVFLGFTWYFIMKGSVSGIILSFLGITGSLMVSYTRARAEGVGIDCKVGLFTRFERVTFLILALIFDLIFLFLIFIAFFSHFTAVQRIWHVYNQSKTSS
ncbi:MAG: CDP-alcohol phosphatidyltransferase family protein [Thermodesulfobacteriaceae bacterium]|nr:CDP-alcohol phosphatidyltransferase family protein [Thermodesulfobacteriaceae bacterium]MCX8041359.1 CDP-alcohol phosphatidyltransferase family protein [Thermodesulfobacteriaceae bacterium]MDW8135635.1 CDP-alcohol phosphatidyltransferase family protein [Thermodesulfobacterium sp.]